MPDKEDWFSPGSIRFTRRQTLWLIQNLGSLRDGHWPPEASNYIGRNNSRHKSPYETAIEYAAEIQLRMEKCGVDGLILEAIESWGKTVDSLTIYLKMQAWSITKRRKNALGYVASGPNMRWHATKKRKAESYQEFKERVKK